MNDLNLAEEHYNNALSEIKLGNYDKALEDLNRAIIVNSDYGHAYYERGIIKAIRNDFSGSISDLTWAISCLISTLGPNYPHHGHAYYKRGIIKYFEKKDLVGAIIDLKEAQFAFQEEHYAIIDDELRVESDNYIQEIGNLINQIDIEILQKRFGI